MNWVFRTAEAHQRAKPQYRKLTEARQLSQRYNPAPSCDQGSLNGVIQHSTRVLRTWNGDARGGDPLVQIREILLLCKCSSVYLVIQIALRLVSPSDTRKSVVRKWASGSSVKIILPGGLTITRSDSMKLAVSKSTT